MNNIPVYKLKKEAHLPEYATEESACFDVHACIQEGMEIKSYGRSNTQSVTTILSGASYNLAKKSRALIPTGLVFAIPEGHSLRLHPRSGLAFKDGITLANAEGVIDSDYYHQTFVALYNHSDSDFTITDGMRVCQGEIVPMVQTEFTEVTVQPSQSTSRAGGFGSTGV